MFTFCMKKKTCDVWHFYMTQHNLAHHSEKNENVFFSLHFLAKDFLFYDGVECLLPCHILIWRWTMRLTHSTWCVKLYHIQIFCHPSLSITVAHIQWRPVQNKISRKFFELFSLVYLRCKQNTFCSLHTRNKRQCWKMKLIYRIIEMNSRFQLVFQFSIQFRNGN